MKIPAKTRRATAKIRAAERLVAKSLATRAAARADELAQELADQAHYRERIKASEANTIADRAYCDDLSHWRDVIKESDRINGWAA